MKTFKTNTGKEVTTYQSEIMAATCGDVTVRMGMGVGGVYYRVVQSFDDDIFWTTEETRLRAWLRQYEPELYHVLFGNTSKAVVL